MLDIMTWTPVSAAKKASVDPLLFPPSLISNIDVKEAASTTRVITMIMIRAMTKAAPDWLLKMASFLFFIILAPSSVSDETYRFPFMWLNYFMHRFLSVTVEFNVLGETQFLTSGLVGSGLPVRTTRTATTLPIPIPAAGTQLSKAPSPFVSIP